RRESLCTTHSRPLARTRLPGRKSCSRIVIRPYSLEPNTSACAANCCDQREASEKSSTCQPLSCNTLVVCSSTTDRNTRARDALYWAAAVAAPLLTDTLTASGCTAPAWRSVDSQASSGASAKVVAATVAGLHSTGCTWALASATS